MALTTPSFLQNGASYSARNDRLGILSTIAGTAGVVERDSMRVSASSPASMVLQIAAGTASVPGNKISQQGMYSVTNVGPASVTVPVSGTNPRVDIVVLRVYDSEITGTESRAVFEVIPGTPSTSPVPPVVPEMSIVLAWVTVAPGASVITNANIDLSHRYRAAYNRQMGGNIITVDNITERTLLASRANVSVTNPLIVWRVDATFGQQLEFSTDGKSFTSLVPGQNSGTVTPLVGWAEYHSGSNKWTKQGNVVTVSLAMRRTDITFSRGMWEWADFTNAVPTAIRPATLGRGLTTIMTYNGVMEIGILTNGRFGVRMPNASTTFQRTSFWVIGNITYLV